MLWSLVKIALKENSHGEQIHDSLAVMAVEQTSRFRGSRSLDTGCWQGNYLHALPCGYDLGNKMMGAGLAKLQLTNHMICNVWLTETCCLSSYEALTLSKFSRHWNRGSVTASLPPLGLGLIPSTVLSSSTGICKFQYPSPFSCHSKKNPPSSSSSSSKYKL